MEKAFTAPTSGGEHLNHGATHASNPTPANSATGGSVTHIPVTGSHQTTSSYLVLGFFVVQDDDVITSGPFAALKQHSTFVPYFSGGEDL